MIILFTSAITPAFFEQRKQEYITSFNSLCSLGYRENIRIVECVDCTENTFLNGLTDNLFCTKQNYSFKNKGVNELLNIKYFFEKNDICDDEKIIKLTGRYLIADDFFIKEFGNSDYDVMYKKDSHNQVFFGCLCLKKKVLTDFINQTNFENLESKSICIEKTFADFIYGSKYSQKEIIKMNIKCNINNNDLHFL